MVLKEAPCDKLHIPLITLPYLDETVLPIPLPINDETDDEVFPVPLIIEP
jgi:hypothetical protein